MTKKNPRLYGLTDANTNRKGKDLWGKNQFNSAFPLSLCLKMRNDKTNPVYVYLDSGLDIKASDQALSMDRVVGTAQEEMYYSFESAFKPYSGFVGNSLEKIDLVVLKDGEPLRPLEVKLTVVLDGTTAAEDEADWEPEMVVRPVSSAYAMMNLAHRLRKAEHRVLRKRVERSLRDAYSNVRGWDNPTEGVAPPSNNF